MRPVVQPDPKIDEELSKELCVETAPAAVRPGNDPESVDEADDRVAVADASGCDAAWT